MTTPIGFHASHEQFPPSRLLELARRAEEAGFDEVSSSDHLFPWSARQGHSGYAWSWLGAAMEATRLPFGVVTAPGDRYHPVVHAQAIATLAELFPDRLWVALGTGQYLNEHVTGRPWPPKSTRNARLRECVDVIRALLAGERVEHDGLVRVHDARVYSVPDRPPMLIAAAVTAATAAWAASWAEGLITVQQPPEALTEVLEAYRGGGGRGPVRVQAKVSWADTDEDALAEAHHQWATNTLPPILSEDLATPERFDAVAEHVSRDAMHEFVMCSADPGTHAAHLWTLLELGFDGVDVHHVGRDQEAFVDLYGDKVLPELRSS